MPRLGLEPAAFGRVRGQVCKRLGRRVAELHLAGLAEYRAYLEAHPEMKRATYKIPHDGQAAGTAAKLVLHVAKKMGRRAAAKS